MEPVSPIELLAAVNTGGVRVRVAKGVDAPKVRCGVIFEVREEQGGCLVKHDDGATYGWSWKELIRELDPEAPAIQPEAAGQIWIYRNTPIALPATSTFSVNLSFGTMGAKPEPPSYMDMLSKAQDPTPGPEPEPEPAPESVQIRVKLLNFYNNSITIE